MEGHPLDRRLLSRTRGSPSSTHMLYLSASPATWDWQRLCADVHYTYIYTYIYMFSFKRRTWTSFLTHEVQHGKQTRFPRAAFQ